MTVIFKKSFLRCKEVKRFVRKSRLDEFKRRILEHLDALEAKERKKAKKSAEALCAKETMRKAGYPVGTVREWKGKKFIKVAPNKWRPKYDSDSTRGARQSIAAIKKKVSACATAEELLQVVKENKHRFTDADGKYLPFVKELFGHVSEKKKEIRGGARQGKAEAGKKEGAVEAKEQAGNAVTQLPGDFIRDQIRAYFSIDRLEGRIKELGKNERLYEGKISKFANLCSKIMSGDYNGGNIKDKLAEIHKRGAELSWQLNDHTLVNLVRNLGDYVAQLEKEKDIPAKLKELSAEQTERARRQAIEGPRGSSEAEKPADKGKEEKPAVVRSPGIMKIRAKYESSKSITGNEWTIVLPDGREVECHYRIVEADAPTASHDEENFSSSEGFPTNENGKNINDRDYEHDTDAQEAVKIMGSNFDARAIGNPPIVTKDGIVVSGNNRTMSSKLAARNGTDGKYIESLRKRAKQFGINPSDLDGFKNPRLILEVDAEHEGDYTTKEFAAYNQDDKKTMNNVQKAVKIGKMLDAKDIELLANSIAEYESLSQLYDDPQGCIDFVNTLVKMGVILETDRAQYMSADGSTLNGTGRDFVETVLVGSLLTEENVRACDGAGGRSIRKKLVRAILPLVENKGGDKAVSFNKELNDAVNIAITVSKNHKKWKTVGQYLEETIFEGEGFTEKIDPIAGKLAEIIHDERELAFAQRIKDLGAKLRESAIYGGMEMCFEGDEEDEGNGSPESRKAAAKEKLLRQLLDVKKAVAAALQRAFGNLGKSA